MYVLVPVTINDSVFSSSTVAEPAAGETAWASGGTYAIGDLRIRATTHRVYRAVQASSGRTTLPENDPNYWQDYAPTNRWAAFDDEVSTQSSVVTPLTFVLRPGFFNAIALYGIDGAHITITVKDAPGGAVIYSYDADLQEPPVDWYEWLFAPIIAQTKVVVNGIVPYPDAELTITITSAAGTQAKLGMLTVGDLRPLIGAADWGGTEAGAVAEPIDYSYVKTDFDGTTRIVRRRNATDLHVRVNMPKSVADYALATVQEVLSVPCAWIATLEPGYAGLNVFGLGSGSISYEGTQHAIFTINVKGLV